MSGERDIVAPPCPGGRSFAIRTVHLPLAVRSAHRYTIWYVRPLRPRRYRSSQRVRTAAACVGRAVSDLCAVDDHAPGLARRARRAETGASDASLYAMRMLRLDPRIRGFKKSCPRSVGDVMGKYHPHGDAGDLRRDGRAWRRISTLRYPLVDGQGNFGNIDGDNAGGHTRYTEARLTAVADGPAGEAWTRYAVDFRETYDGEDTEPVVLPGAVSQPAGQWRGRHCRGHGNGSFRRTMSVSCVMRLYPSGRTSIIPNWCAHETLIEMVPGPDLPTGGVIVDTGREHHRGLQDRARAGFRLRVRSGRYRGSWGAAPGRSSSPRSPTRCRNPSWSRKHRRASDPRPRRSRLLADVRDEIAEDIRLILEPRSALLTRCC